MYFKSPPRRYWEEIEARGSDFIADYQQREWLWWPEYDQIIGEIIATFGVGREFEFDDRMEYSDGWHNGIYNDVAMPEFRTPPGAYYGSPEWIAAKYRRRELWDVLNQNNDPLPHPEAGKTGIYLGIVHRGGHSNGDRLVSYNIIDPTTRSGYRKKRMMGRYFLKWAMPFDED